MLHNTKAELEIINVKVTRVKKRYVDYIGVVIELYRRMSQSASKFLSRKIWKRFRDYPNSEVKTLYRSRAYNGK